MRVRRPTKHALALALIGLIGLSAPGERAVAQSAPGARDCFWVSTFDERSSNVAFPDAGAAYYIGRVTLPPGGELRLRGRYPFSRYMSFNAYDPAGRPTFGIPDVEITPNPGSRNPFGAGARRFVPKRSYEVRVVADPPPASGPRAPNTVYLGSTGRPNVSGSLVYRNYVPNRGLDDLGGVPLPEVFVRLANGTELDQKASCDFERSNADNPPFNESQALASSDGLRTTPYNGTARNPTRWFAFFNFVQSTGQSISDDSDRITPQEKQGGFFSDSQNYYAYTFTSRGYGPVVVLEGRVPTYPRTRDGQRTFGASQLRYWSMCQGEQRTTQTIDCVSDPDLIQSRRLRPNQGGGGRYTIVVSSPSDRPSNAIPECGVNTMDFGPAPTGVLIMRNQFPSPAFQRSLMKVTKQGTVEQVLGEYLPRGRHMSRRDFERRGCARASQVGASGKIQLSVSPGRVRAGRRVRFRMHATTVSGGTRRAVTRATVHFAGASGRTDSRGRLTLSRRVLRPGRHRARASKRGLRSGSASVRVLSSAPHFTG